jgi:hypothetical protein
MRLRAVAHQPALVVEFVRHALDRNAFLAAVGSHRYSSRTADSIADERTVRVPVA